MDSRTPMLILFGSLFAALSLAILGLAANNAAYHHKHQDSALDVHYMRWNATANAQYSYWLALEYAPSHFSLSQTYAELATGVICALVGAGVAVGAWVARGQKTGGAKNKRTSVFLPTTLALTTLSLILSLPLTIYSFRASTVSARAFKTSVPVPPIVSDQDVEPPTKYQSSITFSPETWTCNLAPLAVLPAQARALQSQCQEAQVAKYLMVPVVIVAAAMVACAGWMMLKAKKAGSEEGQEMEGGKEVDEVSVETASVQTKN